MTTTSFTRHLPSPQQQRFDARLLAFNVDLHAPSSAQPIIYTASVGVSVHRERSPPEQHDARFHRESANSQRVPLNPESWARMWTHPTLVSPLTMAGSSLRVGRKMTSTFGLGYDGRPSRRNQPNARLLVGTTRVQASAFILQRLNVPE
jgi:hypothetical protein